MPSSGRGTAMRLKFEASGRAAHGCRYLLGQQYLKLARSQHGRIASVEAEKSGFTGFEKAWENIQATVTVKALVLFWVIQVVSAKEKLGVQGMRKPKPSSTKTAINGVLVAQITSRSTGPGIAALRVPAGTSVLRAG